MPKRPVDDATMQTYLESLPEGEVVAIFEAVRRKMNSRWDFRIVVFLAIAWCGAWIWFGGFGLVPGFVAGIVGMVIAAALLWPLVGWLHKRALKDEVAMRISANGV